MYTVCEISLKEISKMPPKQNTKWLTCITNTFALLGTQQGWESRREG